MRSLSTLYRVAYGRLMNAKEGEYTGMCQLMSSLLEDNLYNLKEFIKIRESLRRNKPSMTRHLEFFAMKEFDDEDFFWFPKGEVEIRKQFLHKMINYSKPWYIRLYLLWTNQLA